jgi:hypothetical protein
MSPQRLFPLLVVISRKDLLRVAKQGVSQGHSRPFEADATSPVDVEPVLPGCDCYPPRGQLDVGRPEASTTFWVVPRVLGKVVHARVVLRQGGSVLAEVPLDIRVAQQTASVLCGGFSLVLPVALMLLKHFRLDFESQLQDGFSVYAALAAWALRSVTPEVLGGLLLAAALALYLWLRPRPRDVFWDIDTAPEGREEPARPPEQTGAGREEQARRFARADEAFKDRQYREAARLYQRGLERGVAPPAVYFRAALAAHFCGETGVALATLEAAQRQVPACQRSGAMWYNMGCFATRLGRLEDAMRYLQRAVDAGYNDPRKFRADLDLAPLRWRPPFQRLVASLGD